MRSFILKLCLSAFTIVSAAPAAAQPAEPHYKPSVFRGEFGVGVPLDADLYDILSLRLMLKTEYFGHGSLGSGFDTPLTGYAGAKFRPLPMLWVAPQLGLTLDRLTTGNALRVIVPSLAFKAMPGRYVILSGQLDQVFRGKTGATVRLLHGYYSLTFSLPQVFIPSIGLQVEHWDQATAHGGHLRWGGDSWYLQGEGLWSSDPRLPDFAFRFSISLLFEDLGFLKRYEDIPFVDVNTPLF